MDAVAFAHFTVVDQRAHRVVKVGAVDIDTEARLIAFLQTDGAEPDAVAGVVEHPERIGGRGHRRENGIELNRVGLEGQ